jgi:hypothetical protein
MNKTDTASESPKPATTTAKNGNIMHTAADKIISKGLNVGPNFRVNRFKIDNRPVQFHIVPPLPEDICDVSHSPFPYSLSLLGFSMFFSRILV